MDLKPGAWVEVDADDATIVPARRRPERLAATAKSYDKIAGELFVGSIPTKERCLYLGSSKDMNETIVQKGSMPYGFRPKPLVFYALLWGDKMVWVSSADCDLFEVK